MDLAKAIQFGQLVHATYATSPGDLTNKAGQAVSAGGVDYTVVTTIYANDLATDMNPGRADDEVSIGLICRVDQSGDVVIAIRGTEGILEWLHDAVFLQVPCPFLAGAGHTEDGFTDMYESMRKGADPDSPTVVGALRKLPFPVRLATPAAQLTQVPPLLARHARRLTGVDLGLAHPLAQRLRVHPQPTRDRAARSPTCTGRRSRRGPEVSSVSAE